MRKILILILIVLLLVLGYFAIFRGISIFGIEVLSIFGIQNKNEGLDRELKQVSTLTSVNQPQALSELNENAKQLLIAKEEYNDKVLYSSTESIEAASKTKPYKTEYLWVVLGNHAKKNSINLKYELRQASTGISGQYDIYFTVTGSYVSISEFVASLENDSSLNFKIESFKIVPYSAQSSGGQAAQSTDRLQATFTVKEVDVEVDNTTSTGTAPVTTNTNLNTNNTTTNSTTSSTANNTAATTNNQ